VVVVVGASAGGGTRRLRRVAGDTDTAAGLDGRGGDVTAACMGRAEGWGVSVSPVCSNQAESATLLDVSLDLLQKKNTKREDKNGRERTRGRLVSVLRFDRCLLEERRGHQGVV
jgi:hypothetical protein